MEWNTKLYLLFSNDINGLLVWGCWACENGRGFSSRCEDGNYDDKKR